MEAECVMSLFSAVRRLCLETNRRFFEILAMIDVALWEPEIPPNTGNVMRLCAATGATLHLIGRLGFRTDDRSLRRAAVDYRDRVDLRRHATLADFESAVAPARVLCFSAHAPRPYTSIA